MLLFAVIPLLAWAAHGIPTVAFPLNSQVPPVARASQPFEFHFSPGTFAQALGPLQYRLSASPPWLSLDSPNRRLYGTPTEKDVGAPQITIIAEDASGSVPMQATLIVSADAAPKLNVNVSDTLAKAGKLSGPSSLSLLPSKQYSIEFPGDAFTSTTTTDLTYYATLSDRSPLPSWVSFNADSMVFSGTTSASPQMVELMLIASDVTGFAGAWVIFTLAVSAHQLIFTNVEQTASVTPGSPVSVKDVRGQLSLDGKPLVDSDLEKATANAPEWLEFDPKTLEVGGTAPNDVKPSSFTISATDKFGDVANTTVQLTTASGLFKGEVGTLNAVIGEPAKFDLSTVIATQPGLRIDVDLGAAAQWLHFNQTSLTIQGEIPGSATPQTIHGSIKATSADGSQSDSGAFDMVVKAATATGSNGSTPRSTSSTSNASTTAETSETSTAGITPKKASTNHGVIIAISVICLVLLIIAIVLGFLLYKRCKRARRPGSPKRRKEDISRPIYHGDDWRMAHDAFLGGRDVEKGEGAVRHTEDVPPQIATPSPLKRATRERRGVGGNYRQSHGTSIGDGEREVLQSAIHSGDWSVSAPAVRSEAGPSSRIPEDSPARGRRVRRSDFKVHRDSQDSYGRPSGGLPARRRVHGLGHGRASFGSPSQRFSSQRSRGASSYSSFSTLSTGMLSNGLLSPTGVLFPAPPPSPNAANRYSNTTNMSVRMVHGSPSPENSSILADTRPLDERRQSYIRNRATSRSPFFAACESSRGSSSRRPSMIGALAESLASGDGVDVGTSILSYTTAGATQRSHFPGSLRRKRTGKGTTARAYSQSSSVAEPPRIWRSPRQGSRERIGPLTGNAPTESPRSSVILSGLSDSTYATTEGTGTEERDEDSNNSGRSPIDDPAELRPPTARSDDNAVQSSTGSSSAADPTAFLSSPLSPTALKITKQHPSSSPDPSPLASRSTGKENPLPLPPPSSPSPTKSFKSNITTSPFHHRRARSTTTTSSTSTSASPTKTKRPTTPPPPPPPPPPKSPHRSTAKTPLSDLAYITSYRGGGGGGGGDENTSAAAAAPSLALLLSPAVRAQLRQRDSIINRGRQVMPGSSSSSSAAGARTGSSAAAGRYSSSNRGSWRGDNDTENGRKGKRKRFSVLDVEEKRKEGEGGDAGVGAEAGGGVGGGSLRVPLGLIGNNNNNNNNSNLLAPSSLSPGGFGGGGGGMGLGNSGFGDKEAVRLGEGPKARRPVSVEGTNRWSSLRGMRETAAGAERGEVAAASPVRPATAGGTGSQAQTQRESSVLGNEAFL